MQQKLTISILCAFSVFVVCLCLSLSFVHFLLLSNWNFISQYIVISYMYKFIINPRYDQAFDERIFCEINRNKQKIFLRNVIAKLLSLLFRGKNLVLNGIKNNSACSELLSHLLYRLFHSKCLTFYKF